MTVRSSGPNGAELHNPDFRFRVLCSIKDLVDDALQGGLDQFSNIGSHLHTKRRLLGILASACESYAAESRQLGLVAGEQLGKEFDTTAEKIEAKLRSISSTII
jgi:hypothetical protein|eukprot:jgi/Picre1/31046/NNA_006403.t1